MHEWVTEDPEPGDDLVVAVEDLVRHVRRSSLAGGLSPATASALGRLGREGPQRLTDLARDEGVSQPNMTQLVNRMERDGTARRVADARDGRGVLVEVTAHGRAVLRQRRAERAEALARLIDALDESERRAVETALPALARVIRDRGTPGT
ncbi:MULTISPECIES: MarR family winged helix-turn-helix transcriptional regulator [unclassified Streptomyces]|uniref:MarR family winged helix-turn-helix transcriptional regulator n=1 Tax=unclassified Streptomyces TaxID=2593676 RepID=UPI000CD57DA7|nr:MULTISPECIES: MarR family transcriptional regulator [unclassified Streptomyces]AWL37468.1 MarR family transcriptional regulator [Streptomyces sp. SM18]